MGNSRDIFMISQLVPAPAVPLCDVMRCRAAVKQAQRGSAWLPTGEDRLLQREREEADCDTADRVVPKVADLLRGEEERQNKRLRHERGPKDSRAADISQEKR